MSVDCSTSSKKECANSRAEHGANGGENSKAEDPKIHFQVNDILTEIGVELESMTMSLSGVMRRDNDINIEERKYLQAVERGDWHKVKHLIENAVHYGINVNCIDSLGRSAIIIAIDNEHTDLLENLLNIDLEPRDALLHAIQAESVECVELLLYYQKNSKCKRKTKDLSDRLGEIPSSTFSPDITPIMLAAHMDNYEILKILLNYGFRVSKPHDSRCCCQDCDRAQKENSLRHSKARLNAFRALTSPCLICLTSNDPILTAFEISAELRRLGNLEVEFQEDYLKLSKQATLYCTSLLEQTRSSEELSVVLNYDFSQRRSNPLKALEAANDDTHHMQLSRLKLAVQCGQKEFVAHPHCQQLLATLWYGGLPGFRRKPMFYRVLMCCAIAASFPVLSITYMIMPRSETGQFIKHPFIKFICHLSSYLLFLLLLFLSAIHFEYMMLGTLSDHMNERGAKPTIVECIIIVYVFAFIWDQVKQMRSEGFVVYVSNTRNVLDMFANSLYVGTLVLRLFAFLQVYRNPSLAKVEREKWDSYDPILISEIMFSIANILSMLKLINIFTVNPHLGPLQISLGRIANDIVNMFFVYILLLSSFACGLNQLFWVYSRKRYDFCKNTSFDFNATGPLLEKYTFCTTRGRYFTDLFQILQTLYWAAYGVIDLSNLNLEMRHSVTEFFGKLMFGSYCLITIIVIISMLIAMMSNSYQRIYESQDVEWKFARSTLWLSYFEIGCTVPAPLNILPTYKDICRFYLWIKEKAFRCDGKLTKEIRWKSIKKMFAHVNEKEQRYQNVMRDLIQRYLVQRQCINENDDITEDDLIEIKGDISSFRYELLDILSSNGMKMPPHKKEDKVRRRSKKRSGRRLDRLDETLDFSQSYGLHSVPLHSQNCEDSICSVEPKSRAIENENLVSVPQPVETVTVCCRL